MHQNRIDFVGGVEAADGVEHFLQRRALIDANEVGAASGIRNGRQLVANVKLRLGALAHEDDSQPRGSPVASRERLGAGNQLGAYLPSGSRTIETSGAQRGLSLYFRSPDTRCRIQPST